MARRPSTSSGSRAFAERATVSLWVAIVGAVVGALGAPGCLERRDEPASNPEATRCTSCHGDPSRPGSDVFRAAPPFDLMRNSDPQFPGVGAHQIHLNAGPTHAAIACEECHVVPKDVSSPGHADDGPPGDVTFGALARQGDREPYYDPAARTCQASYCHRDGWPTWTSPRTSDKACGSCHGLPPPAPHPQSDRCSACHGEVIDAERHFIAPERHVDGIVDYKVGDCTTCHGSKENAAPPVDTLGNSDVSAIGVGAHQAHLTGGDNGRPLECAECHVVPTQATEPMHVDGLPAELTFSGIARSDKHDPTWSHSHATCGNTYCHAPSPGDGRSSPVWNEDKPIACTSCHDMPPPAPHPQSEQCSACHGAVVDTDNRTIIDKTRHVDGNVDYMPNDCNTCHGSSKNPAPPKDTSGHTSTSAMGVGAHQAHLSGGNGSRPLECGECNVVPKQSNEPQHIDGLPAELVFSGIALTIGREPAWHESTATCSDTYCHAPSPGQRHDSAVWNEDKSLGCSSCHGLPPPLPHPQSDQCSACHSQVVAADNRTILDRSLHVNGTANVDFDATCSTCHGSKRNAAPPLDAEGNDDTASPGVGAHQTHVRGTERSRAVPCQECHQVPKNVLDPGHVDSARPAELLFSGVAVAHGAEPSYENGTCQMTACHGAVGPDYPLGGSNTTPTWTNVDGTEAACGSCHGIPPPPPHVGPGNPCHDCHDDVADDDVTFTRPEQHVDGIVTLRFQ